MLLVASCNLKAYPDSFSVYINHLEMRTEAVNDHNLIENNCLEQLREFLQRYRLSQYYGVFVSEGFDRLLSVSSAFFTYEKMSNL
jgi:hypothetical protein